MTDAEVEYTALTPEQAEYITRKFLSSSAWESDWARRSVEDIILSLQAGCVLVVSNDGRGAITTVPPDTMILPPQQDLPEVWR